LPKGQYNVVVDQKRLLTVVGKDLKSQDMKIPIAPDRPAAVTIVRR
jgi:hypothetical protein